MRKSREEIRFEFAKKLRIDRKPENIIDILTDFKKEFGYVSSKELELFSSHPRFEKTSTPQINEFISKILLQININSLLDTNISGNSPGFVFKENNPSVKLIGFNKFLEAIDIAKVINSDFISLDKLEGNSEPVDCIVGTLPLGERRIVTDKIYYDSFELYESLNQAKNLNKDGLVMFTVPRTFISDKSPNSTYHNLGKFGLCLNAAISLPPGTFKNTTIESLLVILSKKKTNKLFVGELSLEKDNEELVLNFFKFKQDKNIFQGKLVDFDDFVSYKKLLLLDEIAILSKDAKLDLNNLGEYVIEINSCKQGEKYGFKTNSIFIPKIGNSEVVSDIDKTKIKHQNYYQVVLNNEFAIAEYVAKFLNTEIGTKIREASKTGSVISVINKSEVEELKIFLPNITTQKEIVSAENMLKNISKQITIFDKNLTLFPENLKKILGKIQVLSSYLEMANTSDAISAIIARKEGGEVEFKETLRKNVRTGKYDEAMKHSVLKTIVAFLNSNGGTLLVGVKDEGEITGIEEDGFENSDKFYLHFIDLVKKRIGAEYGDYIKSEIAEKNNKHILKVDCIPCKEEVWLKEKGKSPVFFVRQGPETNKLEGPELIKYIQDHFKK